VTLTASTTEEGGIADSNDPNLLIGGKLVEPRDCTGEGTFAIPTSADVKVVFACGSEL
jgi:hypothetical protein